jgi:hypothetical protein
MAEAGDRERHIHAGLICEGDGNQMTEGPMAWHRYLMEI